MLTYKVKVINEGYLGGVVTDDIYIVLVGVNSETAKHQLHLAWKNFLPEDGNEFELPSDEDLGEVLLVRLYKERSLCLPESPWYCGKVTVISPSGDAYHFPYYQWLVGSVVREIQEGKGIILSGDPSPLIVKQRRTELEEKRKSHRWKVYCAGAPHCIDEDGILFIIRNDQYSLEKHALFLLNKESLKVQMLMEGYRRCTKSWTNLTDIKKIFSNHWTVTSELVSGLWKEDTFFGYQYLNGVNPVIIKKCTKIPDNFPVSEEMVSASLSTSTALKTELQDGNIFLADYEILLGVAPNTINGQLQYIAAPMCLLWKTPQNDIIPIAIQLGQTPGEDTPIFLPSDTEWDWTLAKMWVRNADLLVHEGFFHLLYTHLLAEVFHVATTRQLPVGHPVYKLIIQHLHYTLDVNVQARKSLIAPGGTIDMFSGCGSAGVNVLLRKGLERMTYTSLCLPDDIEFRGVQSVPNYFYRDDGMSIWSAIERFVSDIVHYYYEDDHAVCEDPELQAWVEEIYKEGFLEHKDSGIPSSLETQGDLTRYLTMVIFTCSARHAAINSGQFDFYSWMPNSPSSMRCPPPARKGTATLQTILDTLPQVNTTAVCLATMLLLSVDPLDKVCDLQPRFLQRRLGHYPEEHFIEDMPKRFIRDFQRELAEVSRQIKERNEGRSLTYLYLDPENIDNSVAI